MACNSRSSIHHQETMPANQASNNGGFIPFSQQVDHMKALEEITQQSMLSNDEILERNQLAEQIVSMMEKQEFDKINTLYEDIIQNKQRTKSGLWQLTIFYWATTEALKDSITFEMDEKYAEKQLALWQKRFPQSIVPKILRVKMFYSLAYSKRLNADNEFKVQEALIQWQKYLRLAEQQLDQIKLQVASKDPEWYLMKVTLAALNDVDRTTFQAILDDATSQYPLYYPIYFDAIHYYFLPKSGGSFEEVENFARYALEKTKAYEGMQIYARLYWIVKEQYNLGEVEQAGFIQKKDLQQSIAEVLVKYPDDWNTAHFADMACELHDKKLATALFKNIVQYDENNWIDESTYSHCLQYVKS